MHTTIKTFPEILSFGYRIYDVDLSSQDDLAKEPPINFIINLIDSINNPIKAKAKQNLTRFRTYYRTTEGADINKVIEQVQQGHFLTIAQACVWLKEDWIEYDHTPIKQYMFSGIVQVKDRDPIGTDRIIVYAGDRYFHRRIMHHADGTIIIEYNSQLTIEVL